MLNLTILAVGGVKNNFFKDAIAEYLKWLKPYLKVAVVEIAPESFRSDSDKISAKDKEADKILSYLKKYDKDSVFILDEAGKLYNSVGFANLLHSRLGKEMVLVIGGSLGFGEKIYSQGYPKISLSSLTFTHEMARLILAEQIYRAVTIMEGKEYHY